MNAVNFTVPLMTTRAQCNKTTTFFSNSHFLLCSLEEERNSCALGEKKNCTILAKLEMPSSHNWLHLAHQIRIVTHGSIAMSLVSFSTIHSFPYTRNLKLKHSLLVEMNCELKTCKKGPKVKHFNAALVVCAFHSIHIVRAKSLRVLLFQVFHRLKNFLILLLSTAAVAQGFFLLHNPSLKRNCEILNFLLLF